MLLPHRLRLRSQPLLQPGCLCPQCRLCRCPGAVPLARKAAAQGIQLRLELTLTLSQRTLQLGTGQDSSTGQGGMGVSPEAIRVKRY